VFLLGLVLTKHATYLRRIVFPGAGTAETLCFFETRRENGENLTTEVRPVFDFPLIS
jgi:hypothetical protein